MDIDFKVEVDHHWIYERPYKVTLTRGAKGDYRWEIEVREADEATLVSKLNFLDAQMKQFYGGLEPTEEEG